MFVSALRRLTDYTLGENVEERGSGRQSDGEDTPFVLAGIWEVVLRIVGKENVSVDCVVQTGRGFTSGTTSPLLTSTFRCSDGELRVLKDRERE